MAAFVGLGLLLPAGPIFADQVPIGELSIHVLDPARKELLTEVSPGETLTLEVGQRVRLRMSAIPRNPNRGPRWPSTRFELVSGKGRVNVSGANVEVGNITVDAVNPNHPPRPFERTVVTYEILDKELQMSDSLRKGSLTIEVVDRTQQVPPPPGQVQRGVVLYDQTGFRGFSESFAASDPQLGDNPIRDNAVSSIRVAPGCEAVLFEGPGFNGRRIRIDRDVDDLSFTDLGNRTASSIQVTCGQLGGGFGGSGVTLYADQDFRGRQEKFTAGDPNLEDNSIGNDSVSSIRVDPGCRATLYEDSGFRGRSYTVDRDERALSSTAIGNDKVSSLRVECR